MKSKERKQQHEEKKKKEKNKERIPMKSAPFWLNKWTSSTVSIYFDCVVSKRWTHTIVQYYCYGWNIFHLDKVGNQIKSIPPQIKRRKIGWHFQRLWRKGDEKPENSLKKHYKKWNWLENGRACTHLWLNNFFFIQLWTLLSFINSLVSQWRLKSDHSVVFSFL